MRPRTVPLLALPLVLAGCIGLAQPAASGGVKEFHLEAVEKEVEPYPGKWIKAWTYNGLLPGPLLRVTEGDLVRVRFWNNHTLPHTIHFHGSHPFDMDGDDHGAVAPGAMTTYEWIAGPPGAYVYHCHVDTPVHIPMGLYGQLIVDPKGGWPGEPADKELFALFSDWNPANEATAEAYLLNGKAFPSTEPFQVERGDRVRVFLSSMSGHPVAGHLHGYVPRQVWPASHPIDVVPLAHAETRVLEFTADAPGPWMFHDHHERHLMNGGAYPGGALTALEVGSENWGRFREMMGVDARVAAAKDAPPHGASHHAAAGAPAGSSVSMRGFAFTPGALEAKVGETVTWTNDGEAPHTVTSVDAGGPLASGTLRPGETYSHVFDRPGVYEYRCLPHSAKGKDGAYAGMVGKVVVTA